MGYPKDQVRQRSYSACPTCGVHWTSPCLVKKHEAEGKLVMNIFRLQRDFPKDFSGKTEK